MKRIRDLVKWFKDIREDITELLKVGNSIFAVVTENNRLIRVIDDRLFELEKKFVDVRLEDVNIDRNQLKSLGGRRMLSDTRRMLEARDYAQAQEERKKNETANISVGAGSTNS